ncbi:DUF881 domain-containing protein [Nocardioides dongxiaopingii]|uniref:DUF881 domain-containing protein n=1 Tax=Nocardioides sp. S-1144 TaxID=2582905 RepID=UPI001164BA9F|nr:DUF881 domain-containing protein [Nocardioides sp. S-1144]QDH10564.1 DUF881 domain-containing protein [Nocardioides sp. S-1144]
MDPAHPVDPEVGTEVDGATPAGRSRGPWRIGTPVVVLLSGVLFVASATTSGGTDLRPGRYTDLASLTQSESESYEALQAEAASLRTEVEALTNDIDDVRVRREHRVAEELKGPAGLEAVSGEGLRIVLSDAPDDAFEDALREPDPEARLQRLVVHQQDIQAVVNALWAGGARAVTIQGQRVVTTTGIRCTGSTVQLQGVPYPEPYEIEAVGDPQTLQAAIDADQDVTDFRVDAASPDIGIGWELDQEPEVDAPAYEGLITMDSARPQD